MTAATTTPFVREPLDGSLLAIAREILAPFANDGLERGISVDDSRNGPEWNTWTLGTISHGVVKRIVIVAHQEVLARVEDPCIDGPEAARLLDLARRVLHAPVVDPAHRTIPDPVVHRALVVHRAEGEESLGDTVEAWWSGRTPLGPAVGDVGSFDVSRRRSIEPDAIDLPGTIGVEVHEEDEFERHRPSMVIHPMRHHRSIGPVDAVERLRIESEYAEACA